MFQMSHLLGEELLQVQAVLFDEERRVVAAQVLRGDHVAGAELVEVQRLIHLLRDDDDDGIGIGGTGGTGYPNLRDDVWIWGGTLQDIQHTLQVGVRADHAQTRMSQMPAFGRDELLPPAAISDMTEYVVKLSGRPADTAAVARAAPVFATQCVACHGADGRGIQALGAPNLTDADWLYGSDREAISGQIYAGRGGVMPAWGGRLSPETIKALTVYVHANAGGQ